MAMTRTQIYLTREQHRRVQAVAGAQARTMADVIREAVEEYLVRRTSDADPLLDLVALGRSGIADGAVSHDRDVYDEDR